MVDIAGDDEDDHDSIFGTSSSVDDDQQGRAVTPPTPAASRAGPPIPGLLVFPSLLPEREATSLWKALVEDGMFAGGTRNQVMLFPSPSICEDGQQDGSPPLNKSTRYRLPTYLERLQDILQSLLKPLVTEDEHEILFNPSPVLGRQIILNLYRPGEGITPHVDLPKRYADGIIGVCLGSGCVMDFIKEPVDGDSPRFSVYLPEGTVYCMVGEARWNWQHGIAERMYDRVATTACGDAGYMTIPRGIRVSVTMRFMQQGADCVGSS